MAALPVTQLAAALAWSLLMAPPGLAKPAARPGSPYARRSEPPGDARARAIPELRSRLLRPAICIKKVAPNLRGCKRVPDGGTTFYCRAAVFLSLRAADCPRA